MTDPQAQTQQEPMAHEDLLATLKPSLSKVLDENVDKEIDPEKLWQYMRLRKADLYYRGLQFIAPTMSGGYVDWSPTGTPSTPNNESLEAQGYYDYNIDIVKGYGRKHFATLGLRPFHNLKAMPDDPQSETDRKASRQADLAASWLKARWGVRIKNIELFYHQWKSGTVYAYTPFVADKDTFGETQEPQFVDRQIELEPAGYRCQNCGAKSPEPSVTQGVDDFGQPVERTVCPQCGAPLNDNNFEEAQTASVPEMQGYKTYDNAGPKLHLCTGYTVTVPFDCPQVKKSPYLLYEYEEHRGELLNLFPELRKKVNDNGELADSESGVTHQQGTLSRQSAASLTGLYRAGQSNRWTFSRYWLAPTMYEYIKNEQHRTLAQQNFPDGMKVSRVSGVLVRLENEALKDVWSEFKPEPAEYSYTDPMCWGILGQQDITNDFWNIAIATLERGLPSAFVDPDLIDTDALNNRSYLPQEVIPAKASGNMRDAVMTLQQAKFPDQLMPVLGALDQNTQQHTGLLPPVWGGGEKAQTAEETKTRLNQALMQLAVPGEYASIGWIDTFTNAIRSIARNSPRGFVVPIPDSKNGATSEMLDVEALREGKWHLEAEPGIPMSWSEKRDQLNLIIGQNPELAQAMGLTAPTNVPVLRDYLLPNMAELRVPNEDVRDKVIETIQALLEQEPIQSPDGQPPMPSIQPEEFVDDPALQAEIVREWCLSPQGRKAKVDNPGGYANVVAFGLMLSSAGQPQQGGEPPKGPSTSISFKDLPPDGQAQLAAQAGIQLDAEQLAQLQAPPPDAMPQPGAETPQVTQ